MHTLPSGRVLFGAFDLDLSTGELRSIEAPDPNNKVLLREQVFQVLRMLLEHEGKIVTREEIKGRLWPDDTVVDFDHGINATIKTLRRALGDSADNPRYIETLARRGYRLMLPIQYLESVPETALEKDREVHERPAAETSGNTATVQEKVRRQMKPQWWKAAVALASVVILVGAGYISWRHFRGITPPKSVSFISCASSTSITWEPTASRRRPAFSSHLVTTVMIPDSIPFAPLCCFRKPRTITIGQDRYAGVPRLGVGRLSLNLTKKRGRTVLPSGPKELC
jgi:DNA-binding winged helix-turn-helix (wHTH) protein